MRRKLKGLFVVTLGVVMIIALVGCFAPQQDQNDQLPVNNPPSKPFNPSPAHEATGVSRATKLSWECSDPDGDTLTYDVYLVKGPFELTCVASGCTTTTYDPPTILDPLSTYYWKVVAKDGRGKVTEGDVWSFTTGCCPNSK